MTASYMSGERKSKSRHTKNAYTKHMYTFWKVSGGFSNKMKGSKLNINKSGMPREENTVTKKKQVQKENHLQNVYTIA